MADEHTLALQFLGTGNAAGVPAYGCDCRACLRAGGDPRRRRGHASVLLEHGPGRLLVDAGHWDLRERFPPGTLRQPTPGERRSARRSAPARR